MCPRRGTYRLARLAARYGPEQSLEGLLADVAHDCPWWRTNPRKYDPRCGARFEDLERNLPPQDDPSSPVFRQRQPGREDVPHRRSAGSGAAPAPPPTLAGWPTPRVVIFCPKCERRVGWVKADLLCVHGDLRLTNLLRLLTADCSRWNAASLHDHCAARYEMAET